MYQPTALRLPSSTISAIPMATYSGLTLKTLLEREKRAGPLVILLVDTVLQLFSSSALQRFLREALGNPFAGEVLAFEKPCCKRGVRVFCESALGFSRVSLAFLVATDWIKPESLSTPSVPSCQRTTVSLHEFGSSVDPVPSSCSLWRRVHG